MFREEVRTTRDGKQVTTKVPFIPGTRTNAKSTDAGSWRSYAECDAALGTGHYDGILVALGQVGRFYLAGIDLDSCLFESDGVPHSAEWAKPYLKLMADSYVEASPSRTGAKGFFFIGALAIEEVRKAFGIRENASGCKVTIEETGEAHPPAFEMYYDRRFFAVTTCYWSESADRIAKLEVNKLKQIAALVPQYVGGDPAQDRGEGDRKRDNSRSGYAFRMAMAIKARGGTFEDFLCEVSSDPRTADWYRTKGQLRNNRECENAWDNAKVEPPKPKSDCQPVWSPLLNLIPFRDHYEPDWLRFEKPEWQLQLLAPRGTVTTIAGPGGIGKSALAVAMSLSYTTRQEFLGLTVYGSKDCSGVVAHLLLEDRERDLVNSYGAAIKHHKINPRTLDQLYIFGNRPGQREDIVIARRDEKGNVRQEPILDTIIAWLITDQVELLIVDPFAFSHRAEENDNDDMVEVMKLWNKVALDANCGVILIHHFTKGAGQGVDKTRGAGAIIYHSRSVLPLSTPLTQDDVNKYGITDHVHNYIRVDNPKMNLQPKPENAVWFHLVSVPIYEGFTVVAAERWHPQQRPELPPRALPDELAEIINDGLDNGEFYTPHRTTGKNKDDSRWLGHQMKQVLGISDAEAKDLIKKWLKWKYLREFTYTSPNTRRERTGLRAPSDQGRNG